MPPLTLLTAAAALLAGLLAAAAAEAAGVGGQRCAFSASWAEGGGVECRTGGCDPACQARLAPES